MKISILAQRPALAKVIEKLKVIEGDSTTDSGSMESVKSIHVTEYSLASYCSLVRYLYTGHVALEVDLNNFAIGYPPNKPFSPSCKNRLHIDPSSLRSLPSTDLSSGASPCEFTAPKPNEPPLEHRIVATWHELFQITDCYQVSELREYCLEKIMEDLDSSTVLDVLFQYSYRYPDLKEKVLQNVADSMTELYSKSKDPFAAYAEHPQRHELMSEALHLVFMARAQIKRA
ncbi:hypothetical protein CPC16_011843 [Podila verticillata]|nr:hypothetical protein CPC16_011843 [Podila verticillata]